MMLDRQAVRPPRLGDQIGPYTAVSDGLDMDAANFCSSAGSG
jgi:hypothetical protein